MIIGIPKETKPDEYRVALLPVGAELLTSDGHVVLIESGAGVPAGFADADYLAAGARLAASADDIYAQAQLIVKVKEPQEHEISRLRHGQIVFTFFHFAASRQLTEGCLRAGVAAVAYETLFDDQGRLPLLTPMSEIAGRLAIQQGARCLERPFGGRGILLGGVPGVEPGNVLILGAGAAGSNAARMAAGLGANVVLMDVNLERLRQCQSIMPPNVSSVFSDPHTIRRHALKADLIIGAVLIPGRRAPRLIDRQTVSAMKQGSVIVDIAVDQGGCVETIRPTTHHDPTYVVDGVVHYGVTNMPGSVGRTSTLALCNATLPYVRSLATLGLDKFLSAAPGNAHSLNLKDGRIVHPAVKHAFPDLA